MFITIHLALLMLAPAASAAEPFPLEIYNAAALEPAAECRAAGFNSLVVTHREQLDLCRRLGLRGVFGGLPHTADSFDADSVRQAVLSVRDHPALECYILLDEADLRPWAAPPSLLSEMAAVVREADPGRPVAATFSGFLGPRALVPYLETVDILRLDSYPFYYDRPMTWALEVIDSCRAATGDAKPILLIQQAWSNGEAFPSPDYDLCLSTLALIHGVKGLGHYAYLFGDRGTTQTLPANEPAFWDHLKAATARFAALGELSDPPAGARVFANSRGGRVEWALRRRGGELLLLAANPSIAPDWINLGTLDPAGHISAYDGGVTLARQSDGGAAVLLQPRETLLARVTGFNPPPACEPLLPVTLELADLRPGTNAYEKILVRNHGAAIEDARIVMDVDGNFSGETRTTIPAGVAAPRVVHASEPASRTFSMTYVASMHSFDHGHFMSYRGKRSHVSISLLQSGGAELARTTCGLDFVRVVSLGAHSLIASASVGQDEGLDPGQRVTVGTALELPAGWSPAAATVQAFLPFLREPLQASAQPDGARFVASLDIEIPDGDHGRYTPCHIRWIVSRDGADQDLWLPFTLQITPRLLPDTEDPIRVRAGESANRTITISSTAGAPLTLTPELALPEGWKGEMDRGTVTIGEDTQGFVLDTTLTAPGGGFGRSEGTLFLKEGAVPRYAFPLSLSRPLEYYRVHPTKDLYSDAVWNFKPAGELAAGDPGDLSAALRLLFNEKTLAVRCEVRDEAHLINATGEGGLWRGDSLQVSILAAPPMYRTPESGDPGFVNFGIAYDDKADEIKVDVGFTGRGIDREAARKAVTGKGFRKDGVTVYIVLFPLDALGIGLRDFKREGRFSLLVNDYDAPDFSDRHWLEFGGGIVRGTDPVHFADLVAGN